MKKKKFFFHFSVLEEINFHGWTTQEEYKLRWDAVWRLKYAWGKNAFYFLYLVFVW